VSEHIKAGYLGSVTPLAPEGEIWQEWREAQVRISELENEVERLGEIVTQCDGIECAKHDVMVRGAIAELKAAEAQAAALKEENEQLRTVLEDLTFVDNCQYDCNGFCQAHNWLKVEPKCPQARAKEVLNTTA
jgi:hypothetical protein